MGCTAVTGQLETTVEYEANEGQEPEWPPRTLFYLPEEDPRIGTMALTDLALAQSIFLLHGGYVEKTPSGGTSN